MCGTALRYDLIKRTRKRHRCFACERVIPKGTMAHYWVNADHGELGHGYNCLDCEEFMRTKDGRYYAEDDGCIWPGSYSDCEYAQWPILEPV